MSYKKYYTMAFYCILGLGIYLLFKRNHFLSRDDAAKIEASGIGNMLVRSPLTCKTLDGVCIHCYGADLGKNKIAELGEAVGTVAAQAIGEPGTQLTMRTFHIGGTAQGAMEESSMDSPCEGTIVIKNKNLISLEDGTKVVMGRYTEIVVLDSQNREKVSRRLVYGSKVLVEDGQKVKMGQKLAMWDPYTIPILTECEGVAGFVDLIDGASVRDVVDEETGIANRVVVDWRSGSKAATLKPRVVIKGKDGNTLMLANGLEARYFLPVDAILTVENGQKVKAGDVLARIPRESSKTRDITGGLPRVIELFEARIPKEFGIISECSGRVEFGKDYKAKRRIVVTPEDTNLQPVEYLIPKGRHVSVREGDYVQKGDLLMDGKPVPHEILRILGVEALAEYLVAEIQSIYRLQGVKIDDKHIEVVIRRMLQKVEITDAGDTTFMVGEEVNEMELIETNKTMEKEGLRAAVSRPVLQGIMKASLQTNSFFSAASFQETTRVLTEAAVSGKADKLIGLKENVIVGRLIPAGTGAILRDYKKLAADRDTSGRELRDSKEAAVIDEQSSLSA
jgi:DNA-directed RNA polymerase subunit beta'